MYSIRFSWVTYPIHWLIELIPWLPVFLFLQIHRLGHPENYSICMIKWCVFCIKVSEQYFVLFWFLRNAAGWLQADIARSESSLRSIPAEGLYMADRGSLASQGIAAWAVVPQGIQAGMIVPLSSDAAGGDFMLVLSEFARGVSAKERPWIQSIASKVSSMLK